jgi:IAA-amino acid hydrolase
VKKVDGQQTEKVKSGLGRRQAMSTTLLQRASALAPRLIEIRRAIHRHPELGFAEYRTAALVAGVLRSLDVETETGVGQTGVIGKLGRSGDVVGLRADMDALPIQEANQVDYASEVPGVMHACGHDVHTACLLGAAMLLKETPLQGQVRLLFQPSEEGMDVTGKSGAQRMIEAGALDNVQAVFALHVDNKDETGTVDCTPGYILAAMDNFKIVLLGRGAHGAQAYLGVDAISLAAQVIQALHTIVSRRIPALDSAVISIGMIQGGTKENNLAEQVEMRGTIRSLDPEIRGRLIEEVDKACAITRALGGDYQLSIQAGYPALKNDPALTALAQQAAIQLLGAEAVKPARPQMGAEDFSYFTQQIPGCYLNLGSRPKGQPMRPPHQPGFDVDEAVIPLGAALMAQLAVSYLENRPPNGLAGAKPWETPA